MSSTVYCVKVDFINEDVFDVWKVNTVTYEIEDVENKIYYIGFVYETKDGIFKEVIYSEKSNMIYGIEDHDIDIDDLEILIKFINLKTYKTSEFKEKLDNVMNCIIEPEYIYKNILY